MGGISSTTSQGASGGSDNWEKRINNLFWLFEQQQAIDHFYKRTGEMLAEIVIDEPKLEDAIAEYLQNKEDLVALEILFENINAIKDIRKELGRRHKGLFT